MFAAPNSQIFHLNFYFHTNIMSWKTVFMVEFFLQMPFSSFLMLSLISFRTVIVTAMSANNCLLALELSVTDGSHSLQFMPPMTI